MRMLFFTSASFNWDPNAEFNHIGLICLCHVEMGDMIKINTISKRISLEKEVGKPVVLVPFPFLDTDEKKMHCKPARQLLEKIQESIPGSVIATGYKHNIFELSVPMAVFGKADQRMKYVLI